MANQGMRWKKLSALMAASGLSVSPSLMAASFQVLEQSAAQLGTAYAGTAASTEDATTAFYNAGGLTRLRGHNFSASFTELLPRIRLQAQSAVPTTPGGALGGVNSMGPASSRVNGNAFVPAFHYAYANHSPWGFGFSVNAPYGLITKYSGDSVARYMATRSILTTTNFSPSIAYRVQDNVSLGAGVDYVITKAHLDTATGIGVMNGSQGYSNIKAHGHGWGWHLGGVWNLEDTRLGLNYRAQVKTHLKGSVYNRQMTFPGGAGGQVGARAVDSATGRTTLPDSLTFSVKQKINEEWSALADVQWTHWNTFRQLSITDTTTRAVTTTNENYRNAYRLSLGGQYQSHAGLTWRAGLAFDQSPARPAYRTARIPDSDRTWLALGARYRFTPNMVIDAGLAHIFFKRSSINEVAPTRTVNGSSAPASAAQLKGQYKGSANVLGIQFSWNPV